MSFAVLAVSDCVSTPFALRPQHGTPAPPLPVICVKLMMMSRMNSMLFSTAHTPIQSPPYCVSSQEIWVLILKGKSTGCSYFLHQNNNKRYFFVHKLSRLAVARFDWRLFLVNLVSWISLSTTALIIDIVLQVMSAVAGTSALQHTDVLRAPLKCVFCIPGALFKASRWCKQSNVFTYKAGREGSGHK